jgi:hypothetical protein
MTLLQRTLDLYVKQCQMPEWKGNVWMLAQEKAQQYPELLGELPQLLTDSMLRLNDSKRSETIKSPEDLPKKQKA